MYDEYRIRSVVKNSANVRTLLFDGDFRATPGQFVMVWLPGVDEKPISVSHDNGLTVKKAGPFTEKMFELVEDDILSIRGPYGNGFPRALYHHDLTIVGGGIGIAPLRLLAENRRRPDFSGKPEILFGGKTADDIIFKSELRKYGKLKVATEDGSLDYKGLVTDLIEPDENALYAVCGPEPMQKATAEKITRKTDKPENIYLCLERNMKCGTGLCGSCSCDGYRVCVDGPVFKYSDLLDNRHFGVKRREKTGQLMPI